MRLFSRGYVAAVLLRTESGIHVGSPFCCLFIRAFSGVYGFARSTIAIRHTATAAGKERNAPAWHNAV